MSLRDRGFGRPVLAVLLALGLGGCFQPMYAAQSPATAVAGGTVSSAMASVDILPVQTYGDERVGQRLRNDLVFAMTGGGSPLTPPVYRLDVIANVVGAQTAVVDPVTDRPELETVGIDAVYTLTEIATGRAVAQGNAIGRATYTRTRQRYASERAKRDAEDRSVRPVVEQIRANIASRLATAGAS
ncbi:hypothetical protein [Flaviflagellibacter deserti]|uniref:LPS-assembly lipoprotein n=1 Tax=Flaviflagellibacter deserti TaxID=2267266 RepID=A0ABV9Z7Q5_9HYPH